MSDQWDYWDHSPAKMIASGPYSFCLSLAARYDDTVAFFSAFCDLVGKWLGLNAVRDFYGTMKFA